jgi:predicted secreted protein
VNGFRRHLRYLADTYHRTVAAVQEAAPEVEDQIKTISKLTHELHQLKQAFDSGSIRPDEYGRRMAQLKDELARTEETRAAITSSFSVITTAVDFAGLQVRANLITKIILR